MDPQLRRAVEETGERLRSLGHAVEVRDPEYPLAAGNGFVARYLGGIAEDVARVPRPDRLQRARGASAGSAASCPASVAERAKRDAVAQAERIDSIFKHVDVLVTPTTGKPPGRPGSGRA